MAEGTYEKVLDLAKRRGFLYPAFELYGGAAGFYDYGPLGALLKSRLEDLFRTIFVVEDGCAEISTPAITLEPVLKASGHVDHFSDTVVSCTGCGSGHRADHFYREELERIRRHFDNAQGVPRGIRDDFLRYFDKALRDLAERPSVETVERIRTTCVIHTGTEGEILHVLPYAQAVEKDPELRERDLPRRERAIFKVYGVRDSFKCPNCKADSQGPAAPFNLMFKTFVGPGSGKTAYLRPETAQAMFIDFPHLYRYFREKLPFGVCQIGRAYRNEISPRQGLIRLREFNQMEVEVFFDPKSMTHAKWKKAKETVLHLVPNSTQQAVSMPIGEAVKKKIVVNAALGYYLVQTQRLLVEAGLDPKRLRFRQHLQDEMAHYANDCWDAEFESDRFGWVECVGIADRGSYDLTQHAQLSGQALTAVRKFEEPQRRERTRVVPVPAKLGPLFKADAPRIAEALVRLSEKESEAAQNESSLTIRLDGKSFTVPREAYSVEHETITVAGEDFVPRVIEPSFGEDRIIYAILEHAYTEQAKEGDTYVTLRLPAKMAPITVGVFPLMPKDGLDKVALKLAEKLRGVGYRTVYDDGGTIGRRYARVDEVGTPFAVTVDYDTLKDRTVTVRDRDTTTQERVKMAALPAYLRRRLNARERAAAPAAAAAAPT